MVVESTLGERPAAHGVTTAPWGSLARMDMPHRPLGQSGLEVSRLSLGSWRTFERISKDAGLAVMKAAREAGINFLDDARYNDETGQAPIPTGYSEVLFGELFRGAGWAREHTIVCNKLWWEFWPEQSAAQELDESLGRMGLDHIDVIYANVPPESMSLDQMAHDVVDLITTGRARAWAIVNWPGDKLLELSQIATRDGLPQPCAAQLPYSLVRRDWVEGADMQAALAASGAPVVASYSLAGGVLTGKYAADPQAGRAAGSLDQAMYASAASAAGRLGDLARRLDTKSATLAVAFALARPDVATVLFGATKPEQIEDNVAALDLVGRLSPADLTELEAIGR
jgi:aryl-alcohol dehydrogenase-like predicted oxidoreductase